VAQGVETPGVLARPSAMGCDFAQGYFNRPLPADAMTQWLAASRRPLARSVTEPARRLAVRRRTGLSPGNT
jgi:predicted signal transduction protein with EAL and GGDEF domain